MDKERLRRLQEVTETVETDDPGEQKIEFGGVSKTGGDRVTLIVKDFVNPLNALRILRDSGSRDTLMHAAMNMGITPEAFFAVMSGADPDVVFEEHYGVSVQDVLADPGGAKDRIKEFLEAKRAPEIPLPEAPHGRPDWLPPIA